MHYPSRTSLQGSELIETVAEFRGDVERNGFAFVGGVSSQATLDYLRASLEQISDTGYLRKRGGIFAIRNLLDVSPEMREVTDSEAVRALVAPVLGEQFFPAGGLTGCLGRR